LVLVSSGNIDQQPLGLSSQILSKKSNWKTASPLAAMIRNQSEATDKIFLLLLLGCSEVLVILELASVFDREPRKLLIVSHFVGRTQLQGTNRTKSALFLDCSDNLSQPIQFCVIFR